MTDIVCLLCREGRRQGRVGGGVDATPAGNVMRGEEKELLDRQRTAESVCSGNANITVLNLVISNRKLHFQYWSMPLVIRKTSRHA